MLCDSVIVLGKEWIKKLLLRVLDVPILSKYPGTFPGYFCRDHEAMDHVVTFPGASYRVPDTRALPPTRMRYTDGYLELA